MAEFDLNIERVLENWSVVDAIREFIANALDEAALTGTAEPSVTSPDGICWIVRDFGRGLRYEHLTQNENAEKLANPEKVVGKFGVGLKDALATFDRHRVAVSLRSAHCDITTDLRSKHGFEDVRTLHALVEPPSDPTLVGTEIVLRGRAAGARQIESAKSLFLHYSGDEVLEHTQLGEVLKRSEAMAYVYVNGLRVATEERFLFSYNVTSLTKRLRKALNRERSNVGRTAYASRVKEILKSTSDERVIDALVEDLQLFDRGKNHDETEWLDVGLHACRHLNARSKILFVTASEAMWATAAIDRARGDGYRIVIVPDTLRRKLPQNADVHGQAIRDLDEFEREWEDSFVFEFVDPAELTPAEQKVWSTLEAVFEARGGRPKRVREVLISETMRSSPGSYVEAVGLWQPADGRIILKRDQLRSVKAFAGTVLHETAHALSGWGDVTREFERTLTDEIGNTVSRGFRSGRGRAERADVRRPS